jgi:hypothetical protein
MFTPPAEVSAVLAAFAPLFAEPRWLRAQALGYGTLLAPANHTLTAARRALGLAQTPGFQNYHRLLNRSPWSGSGAVGTSRCRSGRAGCWAKCAAGCPIGR